MKALVQESPTPRWIHPDPRPVADPASSPGDRNVLVVESDDAERDRLVSALLGIGYSVQSCPGPGIVSCPVETFERCVLARQADTIVLDMNLASEDHFEGVSPNELLASYICEAKPVVALTATGHAIRPYLDEYVSVLPRRPAEGDLIRAVGSAVPYGSTARGRRPGTTPNPSA